LVQTGALPPIPRSRGKPLDAGKPASHPGTPPATSSTPASDLYGAGVDMAS
jgi:hypothetical protein